MNADPVWLSSRLGSQRQSPCPCPRWWCANSAPALALRIGGANVAFMLRLQMRTVLVGPAQDLLNMVDESMIDQATGGEAAKGAEDL